MNPRLIATAVASLAVGGFIGYKYAERQLITEFEKRLDLELNQVRRMYKVDDKSPEDMVERLYGEAAVAMKDYAGDKTEPVAYHKIRTSDVKVEHPEEEIVTRKVFEPVDDRGEIYVLTPAEYEADEAGYEHVTWNYYAEDGVVTDVHEDRIEDYANFIGTDFVEHFEENVVHVRNEVVMIDYEIVRETTSYRMAVLGEEMPPERPSQRMSSSGG